MPTLQEWYTDISFVNGRIELSNPVVKMNKRILNDFEDLEMDKLFKIDWGMYIDSVKNFMSILIDITL